MTVCKVRPFLLYKLLYNCVQSATRLCAKCDRDHPEYLTQLES